MKITVNNTLLELHNGARVKDAIVSFFTHAGQKVPKRLPNVEDRFGNRVAHDGELTEGSALFIVSGHKKSSSALKIIIAVLAIGLLSACGNLKHTGTTASTERQAVIFAVNDMHAAIDNFPKLAYIVDSLQTIFPDMLMVAAGDN
jgi:hypothetical protein